MEKNLARKVKAIVRWIKKEISELSRLADETHERDMWLMEKKGWRL